MWLFFSLLALVPCVSSVKDDITPQHFTINLDLPPEKRWTEVCETRKDDIVNLVDMVKKQIPSVAVTIIEKTLAGVPDKYIPEPYREEIEAFADCLGLSAIDVMIANYAYEFAAFGCTSIVGYSSMAGIVHGRNLDFHGGDYLRNVTMTTTFTRDGKEIYDATLFGGSVGILTGVRRGGFSFSVDERDKGSPFENIEDFLKRSMAVMLLARKVMDEQSTYTDAVRILSDTPLIAPVYFIVGGTREGEGVILTRDRDGLRDSWDIAQSGNRFFVLETNYDHWVAPPKNDDRRDPGNANMKKMGPNFTPEDLWEKVLSQPPNFNHDTLYTTVMSATNSTMFRTGIRHFQG